MATEHKISYEEFTARLPDIMDELARSHDTLLVEKDGALFRIGLIRPGDRPGLPPLPPIEVRREALRKSGGALKGVDVERLKADLRIWRGHDD